MFYVLYFKFYFNDKRVFCVVYRFINQHFTLRGINYLFNKILLCN